MTGNELCHYCRSKVNVSRDKYHILTCETCKRDIGRHVANLQQSIDSMRKKIKLLEQGESNER